MIRLTWSNPGKKKKMSSALKRERSHDDAAGRLLRYYVLNNQRQSSLANTRELYKKKIVAAVAYLQGIIWRPAVISFFIDKRVRFVQTGLTNERTSRKLRESVFASTEDCPLLLLSLLSLGSAQEALLR